MSHGGEGKVSVIDTEARAVVRTLETPTTLAGGGYLVAGQRGVQPVDTRALSRRGTQPLLGLGSPLTARLAALCRPPA